MTIKLLIISTRKVQLIPNTNISKKKQKNKYLREETVFGKQFGDIRGKHDVPGTTKI